MSTAIIFLVGVGFGVILCGVVMLGVIDRERRRPWWRS